jgi:hypothetical protein
MLNYIITDSTLTVLLNGIPKIIDSSNPNFENIKEAIKAGKGENDILDMIDTGKALHKYSEGKVKVIDGEVFYSDKVIKSALTRRIITMMGEGFNVSGMTKFMENMYSNPSKTAVDELYLFLEACNLPITEDGCFLAYKKVREDYKDIHSGTFDNSIGSECYMDRNEVDDNRETTCSTGLHFASYSYMSSFGSYGGGSDRIVIVKINPMDVVSIPKDYNNAKGRCCRYIVVNEVPNDTKTQIKSDCIKDEDTYSPEFTSKDDVVESAVVDVIPSVKVSVLRNPQEVEGKRLKDYIVKGLYSGDFDIDTLIDAVFEVSNRVELYPMIEDRNFNQIGNVVRELYLAGELSDDDLIDSIESMPGESIDVTVIPEATPSVHVEVQLSDKVLTFIDKVVSGIKDGTIVWDDVSAVSPTAVNPDMVKYNDYNALRKSLTKLFKSGELTSDMI